jgi:hypothetical protein
MAGISPTLAEGSKTVEATNRVEDEEWQHSHKSTHAVALSSPFCAVVEGHVGVRTSIKKSTSVIEVAVSVMVSSRHIWDRKPICKNVRTF